jgi:hypothetical protein
LIAIQSSPKQISLVAPIYVGRDVTPQDAPQDTKEIEQLHRQLMSGDAPPTSAEGGSDRTSADFVPR